MSLRLKLSVLGKENEMTDARNMWWLVSHTGVIATYGPRDYEPADHNTGHSTPVVGVNMSPDYPGALLLLTASGNRWIVDADVEGSTPGPEWRGLGTTIVQKARKYSLKMGRVFGVGAEMTLTQRICARNDVR